MKRIRKPIMKNVPALGAVVLAALVAAGCSEAGADPAPAAVDTPAPAAEPVPLAERAAELWQARLDEDWSVVFSYRDPRYNTATEAEFLEWAPTNEPFKVHAYTLGDVVVDGDLGWVEIVCSTSVRKFPNVPPQETNRSEPWSFDGQAWYPAPEDRLEEFPVSPLHRDGDAETALRARFEAMYAARKANDIDTLWDITHPGKRPAEKPSNSTVPHFNFVSHEIKWVEVVGEKGRVHVSYRVKVNDPSMERLPPQDVVVTEQWERYQGDWHYLP